MSKDKIYIGVTAERYNTKTVVQYTEGPFYYPKTDEDWFHLQKSIVNRFKNQFQNGWSFHVYEIPKDIYEQYKEQTKELFNGVIA